jgi:hypothetical protein
VVGGTLRDLLLGGTPKDADLLTSAELHQVERWWLGVSARVCVRVCVWFWWRWRCEGEGRGLYSQPPAPRPPGRIKMCCGKATAAMRPHPGRWLHPSTRPPRAPPPPPAPPIPAQIKRLFGRCLVVGRSFPVCQVVLEGSMVEVGPRRAAPPAAAPPHPAPSPWP